MTNKKSANADELRAQILDLVDQYYIATNPETAFSPGASKRPRFRSCLRRERHEIPYRFRVRLLVNNRPVQRRIWRATFQVHWDKNDDHSKFWIFGKPRRFFRPDISHVEKTFITAWWWNYNLCNRVSNDREPYSFIWAGTSVCGCRYSHIQRWC